MSERPKDLGLEFDFAASEVAAYIRDRALVFAERYGWEYQETVRQLFNLAGEQLRKET